MMTFNAKEENLLHEIIGVLERAQIVPEDAPTIKEYIATINKASDYNRERRASAVDRILEKRKSDPTYARPLITKKRS